MLNLVHRAGLPYDGSYENFVELSKEIMRNRSSKQQQDTVADVLASLLPPQAPDRFKQWFPLSRVRHKVKRAS